MSYQYKLHPPERLEEIAAAILAAVPLRIIGCAVDIEGIVEDFGITIIPRRGQLQAFADGYTPKDPHYIVIAEAGASYPPHYRAICAEEFSHIVLEYDLYDPNVRLPEGASGHELTLQQLQSIEHEARFLAGAILFPKTEFISSFANHKRGFNSVGGDPDKTLRAIIDLVAEDFKISPYRAGRRARDLKLIEHEEFIANYPDKLAF